MSTRPLGSAASRLLAITLATVGVSCASRTELMDYPPQRGFSIQAPPPGKASVVFMRPAGMADPVASVLYDGTEIIGVLMDNTYVVHETAPGEHRFMVMSEAADFLAGNLSEGEIYFALVKSRMGIWRPRFSLLPVVPGSSGWQRVEAFLATANRVTLNAAGRYYAQDNAESIQRRHDDYLARWLEKPEAKRPTLTADDGVQATALRARNDEDPRRLQRELQAVPGAFRPDR